MSEGLNLIDMLFSSCSWLCRFYQHWSLTNTIKYQKIIQSSLEKQLQSSIMLPCELMICACLWLEKNYYLFLRNEIYHLMVGIVKLCPVWVACPISCRYDAETKKLKHMKPLQQKDMHSLIGDLDFLGPYPIKNNENISLIVLDRNYRHLSWIKE